MFRKKFSLAGYGTPNGLFRATDWNWQVGALVDGALDISLNQLDEPPRHRCAAQGANSVKLITQPHRHLPDVDGSVGAHLPLLPEFP
jgi:hypothetical protein